MSFVTELYRVKLITGVVTVVNFLSVLIISYILFSPKAYLNLPKVSSNKADKQHKEKSGEMNGFHQSNLTDVGDEDEEDEIEVYGPSHLLLKPSHQRS